MFKKLPYLFPLGREIIFWQTVEENLPVPRFRDPMIQQRQHPAIRLAAD
jgi:hypothetical protein